MPNYDVIVDMDETVLGKSTVIIRVWARTGLDAMEVAEAQAIKKYGSRTVYGASDVRLPQN